MICQIKFLKKVEKFFNGLAMNLLQRAIISKKVLRGE